MKPLKYLNWIERFYIKIALIILFYPLFSFYSNNIFAGEVYNSEIGAKIVKTKVKDIDEYFRRDDDDDFNPFRFYSEINHTPTGYIQSSIKLNY